jgi:hypothetical protein
VRADQERSERPTAEGTALNGVLKGLRIVLVVVVLAAPFLLFLSGWLMEPKASLCNPDVERHPVEKDVAEPVTLNLRKGQRTTLSFGRDFNTKRLTVPLEVVDGTFVEKDNPLLFVVDEFHRDGEDDGAQLNTKSLHITAKKGGEFILVRICVERVETQAEDDAPTPAPSETPSPPGARGGARRTSLASLSPTPAPHQGSDDEAPASLAPHPGSYEGSITIIDGRAKTFTLPLTIKLSYPVWQNVAILLWVVILAGSFWVWSLKQDGEETDISADSIRDFGRWLVTLNGAIAVIGGSAGAIGVFIATYLKSPDWGADISQWLSLLAAMFTAFVAAATALARKSEATRRSYGRQARDQQGQQGQVEGQQG